MSLPILFFIPFFTFTPFPPLPFRTPAKHNPPTVTTYLNTTNSTTNNNTKMNNKLTKTTTSSTEQPPSPPPPPPPPPPHHHQIQPHPPSQNPTPKPSSTQQKNSTSSAATPTPPPFSATSSPPARQKQTPRQWTPTRGGCWGITLRGVLRDWKSQKREIVKGLAVEVVVKRKIRRDGTLFCLCKQAVPFLQVSVVFLLASS